MKSHQKKILMLKCFSRLRILTSPLFEESWSFSFSSFFSFFNTFSLSLFSMLRLLGVLMIFEEKNHFFKNFFLNEMVWS
jgi:hypothetical protein